MPFFSFTRETANPTLSYRDHESSVPTPSDLGDAMLDLASHLRHATILVSR